MIPAHGYQAVYSHKRTLLSGKEHAWESTLAVVAWDKEGDGLVVGDYGLRKAQYVQGFSRYEPSERIEQIIPAVHEAWAETKDGYRQRVHAWGLSGFGFVNPLVASVDFDVLTHDDSLALVSPEDGEIEENSNDNPSAPERVDQEVRSSDGA